MNKITITFLVLLFGLFPFVSDAHETRVYEIGGRQYQFTVGSLGEPVVVDDKTGVDFRLREIGGGPVVGAEEMIQVEIQADDQKKTLQFATVFGQQGAYKAHFIPTKSTEFSYRLFGKLNGVDIDFTFDCSKGGHVMGGGGAMVMNEQISADVKFVSHRGAFTCPSEKAAFGFPADSRSTLDLSDDIQEAKEGAESSSSKGNIAIGLGALALLVALVVSLASVRRK